MQTSKMLMSRDGYVKPYMDSKRNSLRVYKQTIKECIRDIEAEFEQRRSSLAIREEQERIIVGNFLTSVEIEIKSRLKKKLNGNKSRAGIQYNKK